MPEPLRQFVLLHHVLPDSEHLDLCLDQGHTLATWRIAAHSVSEISQAGAALAARRLPDHRRLYLDYEGPVSGNRGHVTRADRGTFELLDRQPDRWVIRFAGSVLIGTFEIIATADPDRGQIYRTL